MTLHDFTALEARFDEIIELMPEKFTSHLFILKLAKANQRAYVEALYAYRDVLFEGTPAPFMSVHSVLARRLAARTDRITLIEHIPSDNIWQEGSDAAQFRKVPATRGR